MFSKYVKLAGLEGKGYSPHKLRHSYATLLLQNGADLISIKELLGHEDLNSTKVVF
jgi:integrase/recombinase XerD